MCKIFSNHAFEDDRLSSGQTQRHAEFIGEEIIECFASAGAGGEAVIVKDDELAVGNARPGKLQRIDDRLVDVEIDGCDKGDAACQDILS